MTLDPSSYSGTYTTTLKRSTAAPAAAPVPEIKVTIAEDYSSISKRVWDCSVLMSQAVIHSHSESLPLNLSARGVLDVGSGCGLLPISLSKLSELGLPPCGPVVATEYTQDILVHLQAQVASNSSAAAVAHLDWFSPGSVFSIAGGVDTVVMSDCTLDPSESPAIVRAFEEIVVASWKRKAATPSSAPDRTDALVGVCVERAGTEKFLILARERFHVSKVEVFHPSYKPEKVSVEFGVPSQDEQRQYFRT